MPGEVVIAVQLSRIDFLAIFDLENSLPYLLLSDDLTVSLRRIYLSSSYSPTHKVRWGEEGNDSIFPYQKQR